MQNLARMLSPKPCQHLLREFQNALAVLKDVKTHPWQKRTKSLENIKMTFFLTSDFL